MQNYAIDEARLANVYIKETPKEEDEFDDDEFEDEDNQTIKTEIKGLTKKERLKRFNLDNSNLQKLLCSVTTLANNGLRSEEINPFNKTNKENVIDTTNEFMVKLVEFINGFGNFTSEPTESFGLNCLGLDILAPRTSISDNRILMEVKMSKKVNPNFEYCDSPFGEQFMANPFWIRAHRLDFMNHLNDMIDQQNFFSIPVSYVHLTINNWFDQSNTSRKHLISPLLHWFTSHYYLRSFCLDHLPHTDPSICATQLGFLKNHQFYDKYLTHDDHVQEPTPLLIDPKMKLAMAKEKEESEMREIEAARERARRQNAEEDEWAELEKEEF